MKKLNETVASGEGRSLVPAFQGLRLRACLFPFLARVVDLSCLEKVFASV